MNETVLLGLAGIIVTVLIAVVGGAMGWAAKVHGLLAGMSENLKSLAELFKKVDARVDNHAERIASLETERRRMKGDFDE